ncbi:DNA-binding protein [Xanthomonas translucens]|uniref:DNA-binding protein n=1 Tax=Xanthomonas campestris pv. translucens TaxID=343 RepID=UPI0019D5EB07|nr:DNA-binding protein [Xanthomonas translucens]QSQ38913.1 DNA-binding protein [Xanthomonas translucens pv. translucens]
MTQAQGPTRTPQEALADLALRGVSIAEFARQHSLNYATVYQVLHGPKKGVRGEAHRAAVLLRLKAGVIEAAGESS